MNSHTKMIKFLLIGIIAVIIGIIGLVYIHHHLKADNGELILSTIQKKADISMGTVHQTAVKDGIIQWSLDAESANFMATEKKALFQKVSAIFFLKENNKINLSAQKGILETNTNNIEVTGNVVATNKKYQIKTEKLQYKHNERIIHTNELVTITGGSVNFSADSFFFNIDTGQTILEGNVEGTFSDSIIL